MSTAKTQAYFAEISVTVKTGKNLPLENALAYFAKKSVVID
jgi:hypothetical protein